MFTDPKYINDKTGHVSYGGDESVFAMFEVVSVEDTEASKQEGRPIFKDIPHVRIMIPGDNTKEIFRPVKLEGTHREPSDPERFPRQWEAFQKQEQQSNIGTPLEQWPLIKRSQVYELKALNIFTVEQLAAVSDNNLRWMGARQLRENAQVWLEEAEAGSATMKLRAENESLKAEIASLKSFIESIPNKEQAPKVQVEIESAPVYNEPEIQIMQPRLRGRPKKVDDNG